MKFQIFWRTCLRSVYLISYWKWLGHYWLWNSTMNNFNRKERKWDRIYSDTWKCIQYKYSKTKSNWEHSKQSIITKLFTNRRYVLVKHWKNQRIFTFQRTIKVKWKSISVYQFHNWNIFITLNPIILIMRLIQSVVNTMIIKLWDKSQTKFWNGIHTSKHEWNEHQHLKWNG